jgi:hypothetical protein
VHCLFFYHQRPDCYIFFLKYAGELHIIILIVEKGVIQRPKHTLPDCYIYVAFILDCLIGRASSVLVFGHGKGKLFCLCLPQAHR